MKAQIYFKVKLEKIEALKKKHKHFSKKCDELVLQDATYVYHNHEKLQDLFQKVHCCKMKIRVEIEESKKLEDVCRIAEKALSDARKAEREFLNKSE